MVEVAVVGGGDGEGRTVAMVEVGVVMARWGW